MLKFRIGACGNFVPDMPFIAIPLTSLFANLAGAFFGGISMPALTAQASIDISATRQDVHEVLVNFHTWPAWSPWLYLEPDTSVSYRGDIGQPGHGYDWVGNKVGAGGMTLTATTGEQIECDLQFLKPFKSFARVRFSLEALDSSTTRVSWFMDSHLPFFMFFMKNTMNGMIRSDYRRGLALLKDYIECEAVPSHSEFVGTVRVDGCDYVGCRASTGMIDIAESVAGSFQQVHGAEQSRKFRSGGKPFCFYERMDYKRDACVYIVALPTQGQVEVTPPLLSGRRPACSALKVVHTGPYHHLGNAWALLISESRHQKLKVSKTVPPFECYMNDPETTAPESLVTELFLPLQG